jgi:hypothetical protein
MVSLNVSLTQHRKLTDMSMPPLYALRAFETAARLGSFSKAAAALHVTPGAVSRHISTLEAWFDCQLFTRQGPKVTLTDAEGSSPARWRKTLPPSTAPARPCAIRRANCG